MGGVGKAFKSQVRVGDGIVGTRCTIRGPSKEIKRGNARHLSIGWGFNAEVR